MTNPDFKIRDKVRLPNGQKARIAAFEDEGKTAVCDWFPKRRRKPLAGDEPIPFEEMHDEMIMRTERVPTSQLVKDNPKGKSGRPSIYSQELADKICLRLAEGETLRSICRDEAMPTRSTITEWVVNDREGFSDQYARARDMQLEYWSDEIIEIADDAHNDWMERNGGEDNQSWIVNGEHVSRSKLRSDNRKWLLSKLKPERYGEKVTHAGDKDAPLFQPIINVTTTSDPESSPAS